ncbi:MAG TPA: ABC transporter substrate-binding protein [Acidimicrobiia bacterium]|nr:ABC transporter substrate-binding protein [Acidimicrobiia bacterium]
MAFGFERIVPRRTTTAPRRRVAAPALCGVLVLVVASLAVTPPGVAVAAGSAKRSGTVLKIGGLGPLAGFPSADVGVKARLTRANTKHEVKGVTFQYTEYLDDGSSDATAQAAAAKLVDQDGVFAIVPSLSLFTPAATLAKERVPSFGWGADGSFCTGSRSSPGYGFAVSGCLAPVLPDRVPATGEPLYGAVRAATGTAAPTLAVISTATDPGRRFASVQSTAFAAAGFNVVYVKGSLPVPPTNNATAVVQDLLLANQGAPPDAVVCLATTECLFVHQLLVANNYRGMFQSLLSTDAPIRGMTDALAAPQYVPFSAGTAAQARMLDDVRAVNATATLTPDVVIGYLAADMLVAALRRVVRDDKAVTGANVQRAAASMTFKVDGLYGPTKYPDSFVRSTQACSALVRDTGTSWDVVDPYACTTKTVPSDPRFGAVG